MHLTMGVDTHPGKLQATCQAVRTCFISVRRPITDECERYMAALIMESVYGHRIVSLDDPYIDLIDRAMEAQTSTQLTGSILVDFFPFCAFSCWFVARRLTTSLVKYMPAWLPGMEWKRAGLRARSLIDEAKTRPYVMARDAVVRNSLFITVR